jgi:hypothetical protein
MRSFIEQAAPRRRSFDLDFETELVLTTVQAVAEVVTNRNPGTEDIGAWSGAISEMICARLGI